MKTKLSTILYSFFAIIFIVSIFSLPNKSKAEDINAGDISYAQTPENPRQGEKITIELNSYVTDINRAIYSWKIKNKEVLSGTGKKTLTINSNDYTFPLAVKIQIKTEEGTILEKEINIDLSNVDVLWEATDSYVPPFYKGKALPSSESRIRVVAFVQNNGSSIENPDKFITKWIRNGNIAAKGESVGNIYFEYKNSYLNNSDNVSLSISSVLGSLSAKKQLVIPIYEPTLLFYEEKGIEGIQYQKDLTKGFKIKNKESTIIASPYFFSPLNISSGELSFDWFINKTKIKTPLIKNILGLEIPDGKNGKAEISLEIKSLTKLLLSGESKIPVQIELQ